MSQKDLVSRYREQTGSYYNLTVTLSEEGEIVFNEGYYYPAHGDDEGREYDYYLTIEAAHFEAFVSLLMRRCQVKEEAPQTSKEFLLLGLLDRLVVQGALGSSDTIKASLDTVWITDFMTAYSIEPLQETHLFWVQLLINMHLSTMAPGWGLPETVIASTGISGPAEEPSPGVVLP